MAVKHKAQQDGFDPAVLDNSPDALIPRTTASTSTKECASAASATGADVQLVALKDHPDYSKYFKMMRVGLPLPAVTQKCIQDGLDPSVIEKDGNTLWPVGAGSSAAAGEGVRAHIKVPAKPKERKKRLHWSGIGAEKVAEGSIWADDDDINLEIDEEEFKRLFVEQQASKVTSNAAPAVGMGAKKAAPVCLIDGKRAQNGGIALTKLINIFGCNGLVSCITNLDEGRFEVEQLQAMLEFLPQPDEQRAIRY